MHKLLDTFSIAPGAIKIWWPMCISPTSVIKAKIHTTAWEEDNDRGADSVDSRMQPEPGVAQLYSDGSGLDGQVGAAAVLFMQGDKPKVVRFHLGTIADHTVYKAELVGLLLALHLLRSEQDVTRAVICLENQAVLHALTSRESRLAQSIIGEVISQIELIANAARMESFQLDITWIRGHGGNVGNERADKEVKEVAVGHASRWRTLPAFLVNAALPLSIAARRQAFNKELRARWWEEREASPIFARIRKIDPSLPSKKFRKMANKLTRHRMSTLVQLHTGHAPLKKHLFWIGRAEGPTCLTCGQDGESVHHLLFDCAMWRQERW